MYSKILLTIIICFLFSACNSSQEKLSSSSKDFSKINFVENKYDYHGHILDYPEKLRNELYFWTKPERNFNLKNNHLNGWGRDNVFQISTKDYPIFETIFNEHMIVEKIKIKKIEINEKINSTSINTIDKVIGIPFEFLKDTLGMNFGNAHTIEISDEDKWIEYELNESYFNKEEKAFIIDNPYPDSSVNGVILRVTKLHGINSRDLHRKEIYAQDEISYLVRNPKMEYYVIIYNLKNNKNLNDNEDLIRFVALTNEGLFRELQNRKNEFSLIDTSFLKLPQDIKISYAMDNFSKVITTGEYVDIKNKKKSFNAKSIYPNLDFKYTNNSKKMEIKNDDRKLSLSNKNLDKEQVKNDDFIDFDNGI